MPPVRAEVRSAKISMSSAFENTRTTIEFVNGASSAINFCVFHQL
ncbi:hypothetical protein [Rubritalea tangerina]